MKKIKEILANDKVQRLIYGLALLAWIILAISVLTSMDPGHLAPSIQWTLLIPSIVLLLQLIRNNKIIWGLMFAFGVWAFCWGLYRFTKDLIYLKYSSGQIVLEVIIGLSIMALLLSIFYLMRPRRLL